jgi:AraC family transcriptional regulator
MLADLACAIADGGEAVSDFRVIGGQAHRFRPPIRWAGAGTPSMWSYAGRVPVASSTMAWDGMRSEYAVLPVHRGTTSTGTRQVGVAFSRHRSLVREIDGRGERCAADPGAVYVTGGSPITWAEVRDPTEALEMYPDPVLLERVADGAVDIAQAIAVQDPVVFAIACRLRRGHVRGDVSDVEGSALALLLARHVVRTYTPARVELRGRGRLPMRSVNLVAEYVRARSGESISLNDLAGVIGMSPFYFARAFKATTGTTPHAFVTDHRLMTARDLVVRSRLPIAGVAAQVGFANVGHFRRLFTACYGLRPSAVRDMFATRLNGARSDP